MGTLKMNKQVIELSENSVQIIKKHELTADSVLIVRVDVPDMPKHRSEKYMQDISKAFSDIFKTNKILVISKNISIDVIDNVMVVGYYN
jgi:hypothetical protein